jgi:hypothetical protein
MSAWFVFIQVLAFVASAPDKTCDFGPTHHSHIILPLEETEAGCNSADAEFFMSHGATFFCPHTWDVKILATIQEDEARATLCASYFKSKDTFPIHAFRPTLPAGGLPAEALGTLKTWTSPVLYHVFNFGENNDAGPDAGWNLTTIRNATSTVQIKQVLYGRQIDVQPAPKELTYLLHAPAGSKTTILTHFISTGGDSGFDNLLTVTIKADNLKLRSSWPLYLTIPARADSFVKRLKAGESDNGIVHTYDEKTGLPVEVDVNVSVVLDYYAGTSDGFAGFGTVCPTSGPRAPTVCL